MNVVGFEELDVLLDVLVYKVDLIIVQLILPQLRQHLFFLLVDSLALLLRDPVLRNGPQFVHQLLL